MYGDIDLNVTITQLHTMEAANVTVVCDQILSKWLYDFEQGELTVLNMRNTNRYIILEWNKMNKVMMPVKCNEELSKY